MKAIEVIAKLKEAVLNRVAPNTFALWNVTGFDTVHVTATPKAVTVLEQAASQLVAKYGGTRYATNISGVGMLGRSREATFCFKLD